MRPAARTVFASLGGAGIAILVIGTFLPWLRSGRTTRNSYETTGTIRRLVAPDGIVGELFRFWPLIGALCAVAVAAYVVGLRRTGLGVGMLASLAAGGAAIAALNAGGNAYASVIDTGPVTTVVGAAIVLTAAVAHLGTQWIAAPSAVPGRTSHDPAAE